ncbi:MAG: hypothetical protein KDD41_03700 [Flavobacteriales bacterium]|nr:hypothetical protein [Flavobacteriales bacterium]
MAIEIRELVIRVKIEEGTPNRSKDIDVEKIRQSILKECKREIKRELSKKNER